MTLRLPCVSAAMLLATATPGFAQLSATSAPQSAQSSISYPELAALVLRAPVIVDATVHRATRIRGPEGAGVAPGQARFYIEADVAALIRAPGALPAQVSYLADVPLDARGRAPGLKKQRVLLYARTLPSRPGTLQLVAPDAQRPWDPALDATTRAIVTEALSGDAPPAITGVGNAFHVPGSLPGEGETQIFLSTADGRPVSLSVLRRPGQERRWAVALSEIVDEAAAPPARDTLLWYRLACALPPRLPDASLANADPATAPLAREDYQWVLAQLGPCRNGALPQP